jgi:hypothetical protein
MRAELAGPPTSNAIHLSLKTGPGVLGEAAGTIDVVRDGGELEITESP